MCAVLKQRRMLGVPVEIIDDFVISAPSRNIEVHVFGLEHSQKGHPTGGIKLAS